MGGGGKRLGIVAGEENRWMWRRIKYGREKKEVIIGVKSEEGGELWKMVEVLK